MRHTVWTTLLVLVLGIAGLAPEPGTAQPPPPGDSDPGLRGRVEAALPQREAFWGMILVAKDGRAVLSRGYGRERPADPDSGSVTDDSLFDLGSIAKPLTATGAMLLVREGKLSLDDPIEKFAPEGVRPKQPTGILVRHLISHTTGRAHAIRPYAESDVGEAFRALFDAQAEAEPGTQWSYHNGAYCVLAAIIERASGEPYDRFMRERVMKPMGMARSGLPSDKDELDAARATQRGPRAGLTALDHPWGWGARGCTGLLASAHDLLAWDAAIRAGTLLTPEVLADMERPLISIDREKRTSAAMGWFVTPLPSADGDVIRVSHTGGTFGYRAEFRRYPQRGLVIVVLSGDRHDPREVADALEKAALK